MEEVNVNKSRQILTLKASSNSQLFQVVIKVSTINRTEKRKPILRLGVFLREFEYV